MGKRLEKIHLFLSSARILWGIVIPLLAGAGIYGNSETVRNTVHRVIGGPDVPVAGGAVVTPAPGDEFEAQARQSLASIVNKLAEHDERLASIEAQSGRGDANLRALVEKNAARIDYWHGE